MTWLMDGTVPRPFFDGFELGEEQAWQDRRVGRTRRCPYTGLKRLGWLAGYRGSDGGEGSRDGAKATDEGGTAVCDTAMGE